MRITTRSILKKNNYPECSSISIPFKHFLSQNNQNNTGSIAIYYLIVFNISLGGPSQTGVMLVKFLSLFYVVFHILKCHLLPFQNKPIILSSKLAETLSNLWRHNELFHDWQIIIFWDYAIIFNFAKVSTFLLFQSQKSIPYIIKSIWEYVNFMTSLWSPSCSVFY